MKACLLRVPARIETNPLVLRDIPAPEPAAGEVLVRVSYCGVCRTDLHIVEGELKPRKSPVVPGHQVVGVVEKLGEGARKFQLGARIGVAWLHHTDGTCEYCRSGAENLCDAPSFTGYTVNGGYAEYIVAPEDFVYCHPRRILRSTSRAAAVRGHHRVSLLAHDGDKTLEASSDFTASAPQRMWRFRWHGIGAWKSTPPRETRVIKS